MQQTNIMCCSYSQEYVEPSLSTHTRHTLIYQRRWCCWISHAPRCHVQMSGSSWLLSALFEEHSCFISVMNPILCLHCLWHDCCLLCLTCCYFITDLFSVAEVLVISSCLAQFGHALPRTNESLSLDLCVSGEKHTECVPRHRQLTERHCADLKHSLFFSAVLLNRSVLTVSYANHVI